MVLGGRGGGAVEKLWEHRIGLDVLGVIDECGWVVKIDICRMGLVVRNELCWKLVPEDM